MFCGLGGSFGGMADDEEMRHWLHSRSKCATHEVKEKITRYVAGRPPVLISEFLKLAGFVCSHCQLPTKVVVLAYDL